MTMWVVFLGGMALLPSIVWFATKGDRRRTRIAAAIFAAWIAGGTLLVSDELPMQKVAGNLAEPLTLMWIGLGLAAVHFFARGERTKGALFAIAFAVYTVGGNAICSNALYGILEDTLPPYIPVAAQPEFDAVCVLGGGAIRRPDTGEVHLTEWADRLLVAADLYRAGKAKKLVASGGTSDDQTEASARVWRAMGVPAEAIVEIPRGRITSEEMLEYKALIERERWTKVALVSSAYHLPRALLNARRLGLEMTPIAVDRRWPAPPVYTPMFAIPQPDVWSKTQHVIWELVGMLAGR